MLCVHLLADIVIIYNAFLHFWHKNTFFSGSGITLQSPIKTATDPRQPEEVGRFRGWNPNPDDLETTLHKNSWTDCAANYDRVFIGFFSAETKLP